MRPAITRTLWATFALGALAGGYVLRPEPVAASAFTGPFGGSSGAGGGALETADEVSAVLLGEDMSFNRLVLTEASTTQDGLVLNGARIRGRQNGANDWIQMTDNGWWFGQTVKNCTGCILLTDGLSSAGSVPITVHETKGLKIACKASLDTCNSTLGQGTQQTACASATSRTRLCTCTASSDAAPTYAWALSGGAGTVGDTTTCPDVTP